MQFLQQARQELWHIAQQFGQAFNRGFGQAFYVQVVNAQLGEYLVSPK